MLSPSHPLETPSHFISLSIDVFIANSLPLPFRFLVRFPTRFPIQFLSRFPLASLFIWLSDHDHDHALPHWERNDILLYLRKYLHLILLPFYTSATHTWHQVTSIYLLHRSFHIHHQPLLLAYYLYHQLTYGTSTLLPLHTQLALALPLALALALPLALAFAFALAELQSWFKAQIQIDPKSPCVT